jgi:RNA polymerase sigma factor (sigma-70 family)
MQSEKDVIHTQLLVLRCRRGDRAAWYELIEAWQSRLFYYIRRLVAGEEDAWDLLQQTWMGAYEGIDRLANPKQFAPWVYCIARNKVIDHRRRIDSAEPLDVDSDDPPTIEDEQWVVDNVHSVHRALDRLSLPHREVLTLHFLQDLSVVETAQVLGIPPGTVKSRLHHAKHQLKLVLESEGER